MNCVLRATRVYNSYKKIFNITSGTQWASLQRTRVTGYLVLDINSLSGQGTIAAISPLFYGQSKLWTLRGKKVFESTDSLEIESDHRDRDLFRTGPQSYRRVAWNRKS